MQTLSFLWVGLLAAAFYHLDPAESSAELRDCRETSCVDCHEMPEGFTHRVGVRAPGSAALPSDSGGHMQCLTCHDERARQPAHGQGGGRGRALLRLPAARLCQECHALGEGTGSSMRDAHALATGRAHPRLGRREGSAAGIDRTSRHCIGCHDGGAAPAAPVRETSARGTGGIGGSHPIGAKYEALLRRRTKPGLRPMRALPAEVLLPEGKVGCESCHSLFSRKNALLSMPGRYGSLCLACHTK